MLFHVRQTREKLEANRASNKQLDAARAAEVLRQLVLATSSAASPALNKGAAS